VAFKAQVKTAPGLIIEVTGATQKDLFKAIAGAQEVFSEKECGLCHSTDLLYKHRTAGPQKYTYYEVVCRDCDARLSFGQSTDLVTLFAKRKLTVGGVPGEPGAKGCSLGTHKGWTKYKGDAHES
jgi:ribosomal protein L40E